MGLFQRWFSGEDGGVEHGIAKLVYRATFTRADGLSVTESALGGIDTPPDVIVAGNDDMIFGAIEALKARNITDVITIGFDASDGGGLPFGSEASRWRV